jgi:hypothetical protein
MRPLGILAIAALVVTGCSSGFFTERGTMRSDGSYLNTWKWHPQGCTRDPFDGLPVSKSKSILTLVWGSPALGDAHFFRNGHSRDAPLRLEFVPDPSEGPGVVSATLQTLDQAGILLDKSDCSKLELKTQEHAPAHAGGRSTLSGQLQLDCHANQSHLTASVQFERCEY